MDLLGSAFFVLYQHPRSARVQAAQRGAVLTKEKSWSSWLVMTNITARCVGNVMSHCLSILPHVSLLYVPYLKGVVPRPGGQIFDRTTFNQIVWVQWCSPWIADCCSNFPLNGCNSNVRVEDVLIETATACRMRQKIPNSNADFVTDCTRKCKIINWYANECVADSHKHRLPFCTIHSALHHSCFVYLIPCQPDNFCYIITTSMKTYLWI